jgi:outer membrane protein TolC
MEKSLYAHQKMLKSGKYKFIPRLNAFGSYELYDSEIFQADANGYLIGAQLKWDLFDGYKSNAKIENAGVKFQRQKAESDQYKAKSQLEFNKTKRQLTDNENKVKLSETAFNQMKESYRIKQNRFEQGLEKTSDLLYTEAQMLQKELEHLQAIFEYNYTQQYILFLTK